METVLLWILGILLGIVLLALVIVLVLLNIRAGIEAVGVTGEVSVEARYGPVRIPLYPRPRHLKKKKEETEAEQKKSEESEKKKSGKSGLSLPKDGLDVGEIAGTVRDFLSDLTDRLRISRLRARVVLGTDDAAQTGILLGRLRRSAESLFRFWRILSICRITMSARTRTSTPTIPSGHLP